MSEDVIARGLEIREEVLGSPYVWRESARPLQELVAEYCWGNVWARHGLGRAQRSLVTVAFLIALGRDEELQLHLRGALRNGLSVDEIREVVIQSSIYCGVPAALGAMRTFETVMDEHTSTRPDDSGK